MALFKDEAFNFGLCGDAHLILDRWKGDSVTIWLSDMAGHGAKQLTDGFTDLAADCSPDGKSVIFLRRVGSKFQLFKRDTLESTPKLVGKREDMDVCGPRYSPDGHSVVDIEFDDNGNAILVIRNAETGEPAKSFATPAGFEPPRNSAQWILAGRLMAKPSLMCCGEVWAVRRICGASPCRWPSAPDHKFS